MSSVNLGTNSRMISKIESENVPPAAKKDTVLSKKTLNHCLKATIINQKEQTSSEQHTTIVQSIHHKIEHSEKINSVRGTAQTDIKLI